MSGHARRLLLLSASVSTLTCMIAAPPLHAQAGIATLTPMAAEGNVHPITSLPKPRVVAVASPAGPVALAYMHPAGENSAVAPASAQPVVFASAPDAGSGFSSSAPELTLPMPHDEALYAMMPPPPPPAPDRIVRPLSALAIGVKLGIAGIGFDVATPLGQRVNLRGGASFFSYTDNDNLDGQNISGQIQFRSVNASIDIFPFNNRFRISPGVIVYNGNHLSATSVVPGGQTFSLGDANYTSSPSDPIHGSADFTFGNRVAPSLTIGFGNMIPRHGDGHWSIPFEIGAEYISDPRLTLNLAGTACQGIYCQSTSNPQFQANLQQEEADINSDIAPLRFFPILSLGVAYKF